MPITRRQFELGIDPATEEWMERLYDFLKKHKDQAYTIGELKSAFTTAEESLLQRLLENKSDPIMQAIEVLASLYAIGTREVRGVTYYAFKNLVKKGTWELDMKV